MFYNEVLDGLVDSVLMLKISPKAWDFLVKFVGDYAAVVSIGTSKTNESSIEYINVLQNRYPTIATQKVGNNIKFFVMK